MNDLIYLNVGGVKYTTTRATLTKYPNSMLGRMFALDSQFSLTLDKDDNIFIDSDGEIFKHILNYLRYNIIPKDELDLFTEISDYFQIPFENMIESPKTATYMKEKTLNPDLEPDEKNIFDDILVNIEETANNTARMLWYQYNCPFKTLNKIINKLRYLNYDVTDSNNRTLRISW